MGRLVVTEFMTVDGVMEAPGFDEHRSGRNAWALRLSDDDMQVFNRDQLRDADALLFGRTTYQIWAAFWPSLKDEASFGQRVNELPKFVVSKSLGHADWDNTTILRGDPAEEAAALKARIDGELLVYGSADLVSALMSAELVDEYRIIVFPVVLGSGKRLFRDESDLRYLRLTSARTFPSGAVLLVYEPETEAPEGKYVEAYSWTRSRSSRCTPRMDTDRVLATVLFTDIVDSTGRAAALGDKAWRQLLDRHDEITRTEVERWHGKLVKSTGDGCLATFDAPTRALRCAFALRSALGRPGPRHPGRDPHRRGRAPRQRHRRHRPPHRVARPGRGRRAAGRRDAHRPRAGDRHRPRVHVARDGRPPRRARAVGAVRGV